MGFKDWYYPETLEPKWQGHFGNYIDNTLLALHKFQAKKQVFPNRIENGTTQRQQQSSNPFCYAVGLCGCLCQVSITPIIQVQFLSTNQYVSKACGGVTQNFHPPIDAIGHQVWGHRRVIPLRKNADSRSHPAPSMDLGWLSRVGLTSLQRRSRLLRREHRPQQIKRRKGLAHKKLSFRKESREMRVSQLIRPLVEVPLHV